MEAALFQLGLSCLVAAAFAWPACRLFFRVVDCLDIPKIWYLTILLSSIFLIFNVVSVPQSYRTLHTGRMFFLFLLLEGCMLAILTAIYVLFYLGTTVILEHAELKERTHLLEMQSRQYRALQEHMRQTTRLRHDFRHSVHLLSRVRNGKDGYHSTKHSENGIGLTAITTAAEKYGGSAQASNSDTEFFVDVMLKI